MSKRNAKLKCEKMLVNKVYIPRYQNKFTATPTFTKSFSFLNRVNILIF